MEYKFDHISVSPLILYIIISFLTTFTLAAFVGSFSNYDGGYSLYPIITFVIVAILFYWIGKKKLIRKMIVKITDEQLIVNGKAFFLNDIKSFNQNKTNYMYLFTIKINNYTLEFNNAIQSESHKEFLKFKKNISEKINYINKNNLNKIQELGFYNSKYAKPLMIFVLGLLIIWVLAMIFKPENFRISNFVLFILVVVGIIPILFKVFSKQNRKK